MTKTKTLARLEAWLDASVAPVALAIDRDTDALQSALRGLAEEGWLGAKVPRELCGFELGGCELDNITYAHFQLALARRSGALAFLQTQHQSAASMLASGLGARLEQDERDEATESSQRRLLAALSSGESMMGIGYSQLRRPGPPMLTARRLGSGPSAGFEIDGRVPWATGFGFFSRIMVGARDVETGACVFAHLPFQDTQDAGAKIEVSAAHAMAAMDVTQTVGLTIENWVVAPHEVARVVPHDWMQTQDQSAHARKAFFALGNAAASLDHLRQTRAGAPTIERVERRFEELKSELDSLVVEESRPTSWEAALAARARAIHFAGECAWQLVVATGGASVLVRNHAQRIYREAMAFAVLAQTPALQAKTLAQHG